jgi:hypothetical protein
VYGKKGWFALLPKETPYINIVGFGKVAQAVRDNADILLAIIVPPNTRTEINDSPYPAIVAPVKAKTGDLILVIYGALFFLWYLVFCLCGWRPQFARHFTEWLEQHGF